MYCKYCGQDIDENAYVCVHCGKIVAEKHCEQTNEESSATGFGILSFFFPVVGLILYIIWKDEKPITAKKCGVGALAGFITSFVVGVIAGIFESAFVLHLI